MLEFGESGKFWEKVGKMEKFVKSLKSTKFGIILKNIFYRGTMKNGKFFKNMLEFGVKWKNPVKSVKNRKR